MAKESMKARQAKRERLVAKYAAKRAELKKAGDYGTYFALFLFVAVPIPGTGAWTGTLAASILKLDFKKTTLAIMSGVLVAGLIMLAVSLGFFKVLFGG